MLIVGIDTGGTFTDFIFKYNDTWEVYKMLSTPANPAEAVLKGLRKIVAGREAQVVHGSTVATNAILERKGAVTALITNKGFEDVIEIGRQNRTKLYGFFYRKNPALVPAHLRFGVWCRVNHAGDIIQDLDTVELREIINKIKLLNIESIAVSFLFSFKNSIHEKKTQELLSELDVSVSLSHQILSELREYERTSTTIINAYVSPKMKAYIKDLTQGIGKRRLRIMQSNGGSITAETAMYESVRTILSGPAGGVVGAYEIGKIVGYNRLITFDMGGTSTDVALIDNKLPLAMESSIGHYPIKVPIIDIHTVGAGGGSIATIDAGGSLKVGPESAGAEPGPICYGRGNKITVTDADLLLGRLVPNKFLGGNMKIYPEKLERYFDRMSKNINLNTIELAEGIISVANAVMERAVRLISVERGFDPSEFTLFSFGGAGGMHAVFLARLLNIPRVFIPKNPGILSAIGMILADIVKDYSQTVMLDPHSWTPEKISELFLPLLENGINDLLSEGVAEGEIITEKYLDMRYQGQSYEIMVPYEYNFLDTFHCLHEKKYGYCKREHPVELVNLRLRAKGSLPKPDFKKHHTAAIEKPTAAAFIGCRDAVFNGKRLKSNIISRDELVYGNIIEGPAVIVEYSSTIVIPPAAAGKVDAYGNIVIWV
ncbi:MAG: hydantoinase/oxoprolinase family protein [Desulfobacterales bacterium]|nr:hydantoinase/oxoprolinase family protein [Desulfobacterales bacterium]